MASLELLDIDVFFCWIVAVLHQNEDRITIPLVVACLFFLFQTKAVGSV